MNEKLNKIYKIEDQIVEMNTGLNAVKHSVESAHEEIDHLKKETWRKTKVDKETLVRITKLESENTKLHNAAIDLLARSMRDNLLFYNIDEREHENSTKITHDLLEKKMGIENAEKVIKINRSRALERNETKAVGRARSLRNLIIIKSEIHQNECKTPQRFRGWNIWTVSIGDWEYKERFTPWT